MTIVLLIFFLFLTAVLLVAMYLKQEPKDGVLVMWMLLAIALSYLYWGV